MAKASGSSPLESTIDMWFVYILECKDGSFYTGITNDLQARLKEHNEGRGSKYARSRLPVRMVYSEEIDGRSAALKREAQIKRLNRVQKEQLVGMGQ